MERLTEELNPAYPTPKHFGARYMQKIVSSLADYERTGLTPPEIMELKERDAANKIKLNAGVPTCPVCGRRVVRCYDFCPDCGQRLEQ